MTTGLVALEAGNPGLYLNTFAQRESPRDKYTSISYDSWFLNHPNRKSIKNCQGQHGKQCSVGHSHLCMREQDVGNTTWTAQTHLASSGDSAIRWKVLSAIMMSIPFSLVVLSMISLQRSKSNTCTSGTPNSK